MPSTKLRSLSPVFRNVMRRFGALEVVRHWSTISTAGEIGAGDNFKVLGSWEVAGAAATAIKHVATTVQRMCGSLLAARLFRLLLHLPVVQLRQRLLDLRHSIAGPGRRLGIRLRLAQGCNLFGALSAEDIVEKDGLDLCADRGEGLIFRTRLPQQRHDL